MLSVLLHIIYSALGLLALCTIVFIIVVPTMLVGLCVCDWLETKFTRD